MKTTNTYASENISSISVSYDEMFDDSSYLTQNSDYSDSNEILLDMIVVFGNNSEIFYKIANNYYYMCDYKNAIIYYEEVLQLDNPFCAITQLLLGKCYKNINEIDKAIDVFEYALKYYPNLDRNSLLLELGWCYFDIEQYTLAKSIYKSLLLYSPIYTEVCEYKLSLICTYEENYPEAIIYLKNLLKEHCDQKLVKDGVADIFTYHYDLANLYVKIEDYDNASDKYEKAYEIDSSHQECLFALMNVNEILGNIENSIYYELLLKNKIKEEMGAPEIKFDQINENNVDLSELSKVEQFCDDYPYVENDIKFTNENGFMVNLIAKYFYYIKNVFMRIIT